MGREQDVPFGIAFNIEYFEHVVNKKLDLCISKNGPLQQ
jgi:hypothetical protein